MDVFDNISNQFKKPIKFGINENKFSAVLLPFLKLNNVQYILFEVRSANVPQPGEICFPGGIFSSKYDVNSKDTVVRETCEELGIGKEKISDIMHLGSMLTSSGMPIEVFTGELKIENIEQFKIDESEVEKIFLMPAEYFLNNEPEVYYVHIKAESITEGETIFPARELGLPKKYHDIWKLTQKEIYLYKTKNGIIWGITAQIIRDVYNRLKI